MAKKKNPGGRPRKVIDRQIFEGLCQIMAVKDEICSVLDCNEKTLSAWCVDTYGDSYLPVYERLSAKGRISLRRAMYDSAVKHGNATMQIWLSKNLLGMRDKQDIELDGNMGVTVLEIAPQIVEPKPRK